MRSRIVTVSVFAGGYCPRSISRSYNSSMFVRLKLPANTRLRVIQLFSRETGCTFSMSFLPKVP